MNRVTPNIILCEIINKINDNSLALASLPDVIIRINDALQHETTDLHHIAHIIQQDVALSTRILRIANSPSLRGRNEITTIFAAITRLGISFIQNLALCVSLTDKYTSNNAFHRELMRHLLDDAARFGSLSYIVAKYMSSRINPDTALTAGLLSKIGQVIVLRYITDTPAYVVLTTEEVSNILNDIGDDVTLNLMKKWDFPIEIMDFIFGDENGSYDKHMTRRDLFVLVSRYVAYKETNENYEPCFDTINHLIIEHIDEMLELESILD